MKRSKYDKTNELNIIAAIYYKFLDETKLLGNNLLKMRKEEIWPLVKGWNHPDGTELGEVSLYNALKTEQKGIKGIANYDLATIKNLYPENYDIALSKIQENYSDQYPDIISILNKKSSN